MSNRFKFEFAPSEYQYTESGESKLFTKSNKSSTHKFGFWGLRFHAQHMLNKVGNLKVGESFATEYGYSVTRVY